MPNRVGDRPPTALEDSQRLQLAEQQRLVENVQAHNDHRTKVVDRDVKGRHEIASEEKVPSTHNPSEISPSPQTRQTKPKQAKELDPLDNKELEASQRVGNASDTARLQPDRSRSARKKDSDVHTKKKGKATLPEATSQKTEKRRGIAEKGTQRGIEKGSRGVDAPKQSISSTSDRLEQSVGSNVNVNGDTRNAQVNANTEANGKPQNGLSPESTIKNYDGVSHDGVSHKDHVEPQGEGNPQEAVKNHDEVSLEDHVEPQDEGNPQEAVKNHDEVSLEDHVRNDSSIDLLEGTEIPKERESHDKLEAQQGTYSSEAQSYQVIKDRDESLTQPKEWNQQTSDTVLEPSDRAAIDSTNDKKDDSTGLGKRDHKIDGSDRDTLPSMDSVKEAPEGLNKVESQTSLSARQLEKEFVDLIVKRAESPRQEDIARKAAEKAFRAWRGDPKELVAAFKADPNSSEITSWLREEEFKGKFRDVSESYMEGKGQFQLETSTAGPIEAN